jgi:lipoprotein signal peptidase
VHRRAIVLAVALPLAAVDLVWKHVAFTPSWAYHPRGLGWLALCLVLMGVTLAAISRGSARLAVVAGVMVGGVLGNVMSAAWNGLEVPDPIVVVSDRAAFAFNLADIFSLCGILAITGTMAVTIIHNRDTLEARRAEALRRISRRGR